MNQPNSVKYRASNSSTRESSRGFIERFRQLDLERQTLSVAFQTKLEEMNQLRHLWTQMLECIPIGVILMGPTGEIEVINHAAEDMLGLQDRTNEAKDIHELWKAHHFPSVPFSSWEYQGRVLTSWDEVLGNPGSFLCRTIRIIQDVTKDSDAQRQINHLGRLATLGEHVGKVAHDIRNPLASIELFSCLLERKADDEHERLCVSGHLRSSVRVLDQLLANLLVYAKPQSPHFTDVHVRTMLDQVELMAVHPLREHGIILKRLIDPEAEWIRADEMLLQQACLNILLNAIQASPPGEVIEIDCRRGVSRSQGTSSQGGSDIVSLSIRDHGIGMAPDVHSKVFEPFFSNRKGGTGLGLSIVQKVMEDHHGHIRLTSEEKRGTTISMCLPQHRRST